MLRFIEIIAVAAFVLLSAPIVAGLAATLSAAAYFMIFSEAPIDEAEALAPFFVTVGGVVYATLCWRALRPDG